MARDREYEILLQQYNMAVAQLRDLKEQMATKERQWAEYEQRCEVTDGHIRKLCEQILAKDRDEMVLGDAKTWRSYSTDQLISRASTVFVRYNKERTELLQQIMSIAEARGRENDSLRDQLSQLLIDGSAPSVSASELIAKAEKEKEEEIAIAKAPNAAKAAATAGKIEMILEDADDVDEEEISHIQGMMEKAAKVELSPGAVPIVSCKQKSELKERAQQNATMAHLTDLNKIMEQFGEIEWAILDVIGTNGLSKYSEIENHLMQTKDCSSSKLRTATMHLTSNGTILKEGFPLPLTKRMNFFRLSDMGKRIYRAHFGCAPVKSEYEQVCAEHDNAEHGYGIIDLGKILVESGRYISVSTYNRQDPIPVKLGDQTLKYIPDIICKTKKYTEYIEYERGLHTQQDFSIKCNKMCRVTNFLNFVTPNMESAKKVKLQVDAWIQSRGVDSLKRIHVRISTATFIKNEGKWLVQYQLEKGPEPTVYELK